LTIRFIRRQGCGRGERRNIRTWSPPECLALRGRCRFFCTSVCRAELRRNFHGAWSRRRFRLAADVDFHGVHDWPTDSWDGKIFRRSSTNCYNSSPVDLPLWIPGARQCSSFMAILIAMSTSRRLHIDLVARLRAPKKSMIGQLIFSQSRVRFSFAPRLAGRVRPAILLDRHFNGPSKVMRRKILVAVDNCRR